MTRYIIDTNVPVLANSSDGNVSPECRLAAIDFLNSVIHEGTLVVDFDGLIQEEYFGRLQGYAPGVGSRFLTTFFMESAHRIERVEIDNHAVAFVGPLSGFDLSDRKFALLAKTTNLPVHNAVDTDWAHHSTALERAGVSVIFLCGAETAEWFVQPVVGS